MKQLIGVAGFQFSFFVFLMLSRFLMTHDTFFFIWLQRGLKPQTPKQHNYEDKQFH